MNYLAHIFLSKKNTDFQLGNLLADPLKGKIWTGANENHAEGFETHGAIDAFTDANEHISSSKSKLGVKGYLKGVVVDLIYDHFLIKNWGMFASGDFDQFILQFYSNASMELGSLPDEAAKFIDKITQNDILGSYRDLSGIAAACKRIDRRLSSRVLRKDSASRYLPAIEANYDFLEKDFLLFFPELISMFLNRVRPGKCFFRTEFLAPEQNSSIHNSCDI